MNRYDFVPIEITQTKSPFMRLISYPYSNAQLNINESRMIDKITYVTLRNFRVLEFS